MPININDKFRVLDTDFLYFNNTMLLYSFYIVIFSSINRGIGFYINICIISYRVVFIL